MELETQNTLSLIKQNYEFLNTGLFLNEYIKRNDLSSKAENIELSLEEKKVYILKRKVIKESLSGIYSNSNKTNILGYFVELNAFRGIFMAVCECKKNSGFEKYLKNKLGEDRYSHFDVIIRFCRNVLSHSIDNNIKLSKENFNKTQHYILNNPCIFENGIANFEFNYSNDFDKDMALNLPENYRFIININFSDMKAGDRFIKSDGNGIISEYNLFMLSELCYNLAVTYPR